MNGVCAAAAPSEREELERLWHTAFPTDEAADVTRFFEMFFDRQTALTLHMDGQLASMLFLLPSSLVYHGRRTPVSYIYAGATAPAFRGRGCYRALLDFAAKTAQSQGAAAIFLHPADEKLTNSYRRMGFSIPMTAGVTHLSARELPRSCLPKPKKVAMSVYTAQRRAWLLSSACPFIDWEQSVERYAASLLDEILLWDNGGVLLSRDGKEVTVWELFGAEPREQLLASLRETVGGERFEVRTPFGEPRETIGLLKPLAPLGITQGYIGYGLE